MRIVMKSSSALFSSLLCGKQMWHTKPRSELFEGLQRSWRSIPTLESNFFQTHLSTEVHSIKQVKVTGKVLIISTVSSGWKYLYWIQLLLPSIQKRKRVCMWKSKYLSPSEDPASSLRSESTNWIVGQCPLFIFEWGMKFVLLFFRGNLSTHPPRRLLAMSAFASVSLFQNEVRVNKWWYSHLSFIFSRTWQRVNVP